MPSKLSTLVWDALDAGRVIQELVADMDRDQLSADIRTAAAVNWQFTVIGEALRRLRSQFPTDAQRIRRVDDIIGFRNVLVHGYDIVDERRVWDAIHNHLPQLMDDLKQMADQHD